MNKYSRLAIIPEWAASYIENGDHSELTDEEKAMVDRWLATLPPGSLFNWSETTSFYHFNDLHLQGANCYQVEIYYP